MVDPARAFAGFVGVFEPERAVAGAGFVGVVEPDRARAGLAGLVDPGVFCLKSTGCCGATMTGVAGTNVFLTD